MKTIALPIIAALFATHAFADEIPNRVQRKLLAAAPEIDLNKDGKITAEELNAGREKLPEEMRTLLDLYLNAQGGNTEAPEPAKHKTTLPKPPERAGATPFIDPIFKYKETEDITFQDTCDAVRWVRANADKYNIDPNRIGIGGVSAGAFNALHTAFCDDEITGPNAEVAAVISLMGAIGANHIDENDPPVFIAHGTGDNLVPFAMVKGMVRQLDEVGAKYSFHPVDGVAHRLQAILETDFDGKTVVDHSLEFCFEVMELGDLIKESR